MPPCAGILEQSMGARNRIGIGSLYRPARLHSWRNRFLAIDSWAPLKFKNTVSGYLPVPCLLPFSFTVIFYVQKAVHLLFLEKKTNLAGFRIRIRMDPH
jgi:hypothetical protein